MPEYFEIEDYEVEKNYTDNTIDIHITTTSGKEFVLYASIFTALDFGHIIREEADYMTSHSEDDYLDEMADEAETQRQIDWARGK